MLIIFFIILFVWSIATPSGIRSAYANNKWSIEFLKYYFNKPASVDSLNLPPASFVHSSIFLARDAMKRGDTSQSLLFIKDVEESPHPLTLDNYASLLYQNGDYEQALEAWIAVGDDVTLERAASDLGAKGRPDLSIRAFEGLYHMNPEKYTSSLALTLNSNNRYEEALDLFQKALDTFQQSENRTAWLRYTADIYVRQGKYSEAESYYRLAISENPRDVRTWRNLGLMYRGQLKDPLQASMCFIKLIEINPNEAFGYILLAQSYEELGQVNDAKDAYRQVMKIDPGNTTAQEALQRLEKP